MSALNQIKQSEHVFIAGKTGTGKSMLAEIYLAGFPRVVKLDTKNEAEERREKGKPLWRGLEEYVDFEVCETLEEVKHSEFHHIIYVPKPEEMNMEGYNAFLEWAYNEKQITVWIDELMSVCESVQKYPPAIKTICTRGRSRSVQLVACTQRTLDNPTIILANTTHYFIFPLGLDQDRKKVAIATGQPALLEVPDKQDKHVFWYYRDGSDNPTRAKLKL